jgi:flavin-dependent dehydrogenase
MIVISPSTSSTPPAHDAIIWDVIVVGAGPAGAAAALRLATAGRRVILVDRDHMPRGKVCGCCLSPAAVGELERLESLAPDAWGDVAATAIPLVAVRLAAGGRRARIPLAGGVVLSREALDTALVAAAVAAGTTWLPGATVVAVTDPAASAAAGRATSAGGVTVSLRMRGDDSRGSRGGGFTLRGHTVILAAGLSDSVRVAVGGGRAERPQRIRSIVSRLGIGVVMTAADIAGWRPAIADLPPGELLMAVGREGYCGIVRLEDGRFDLAAAIDRAAVGRTGRPADAVDAILSAAGGEAALGPPPDMPWRATPPLTHTAPLVAGPGRRIFRGGDAAGYVEPFTGEGIGWALAAGRLVAEALLGTTSPAAAAALFERTHAAHFGPRHARCRLVARSLRMPFVVAATVRAADFAPWAARRLAPAVVGHRPVGPGIVRPGFPRQGATADPDAARSGGSR